MVAFFKLNNIRIRLRSFLKSQIIFVFVFGHQNTIRSPLHCRSVPFCRDGLSVHPCQRGSIVSVLHQDEGGIGKSIPDDRKISRDPRDFPRAKPEGDLEGLPRFGGARIQSYPAGKDARLIHPCRMEHIDSVKINPSLVMMRECAMLLFPVSWSQKGRQPFSG